MSEYIEIESMMTYAYYFTLFILGLLAYYFVKVYKFYGFNKERKQKISYSTYRNFIKTRRSVKESSTGVVLNNINYDSSLNSEIKNEIFNTVFDYAENMMDLVGMGKNEATVCFVFPISIKTYNDFLDFNSLFIHNTLYLKELMIEKDIEVIKLWFNVNDRDYGIFISSTEDITDFDFLIDDSLLKKFNPNKGQEEVVKDLENYYRKKMSIFNLSPKKEDIKEKKTSLAIDHFSKEDFSKKETKWT